MAKILHIIRDGRNIPLATKAAFWFVVCTILQKALSFITVPIFTRLMDPSQYGLYNLYIAYSGILAVICTMNMESATFVNGYVKTDNTKEKELLPISLFSLSATITVGIFVLTVIFQNQTSALLGIPFSFILLMFTEVLFFPPLRIWTMQQRFLYKYKALVFVTLLLTFSQVLLGMFFVSHSIQEERALARITWTVIPVFLSGCFIYASYAKNAKKLFSTDRWKNTFRLQLPLVPYNLSMVLLLSSSRIIINKYEGVKAVAIYSVAYSIGQIISIFKQSVIDAFHPWIYGKLKENNFKQIEHLMRILLFILFAVAFSASSLAPYLVRFFAPKEYYDAVYIVPFVSAIVIYALFNQVFIIIETYYEKTKTIMFSSVLTCAINIILNIALIPVIGYMVAGFTALVSYMALSYLNYFYLCKIETFKNPFRKSTVFTFPLILSFIISSVSFLYHYEKLLVSLNLTLLIVCFIKRNVILSILKNNKIKK